MTDITLARKRWHFDPTARLGEPGGFGEVFLGHAEDGSEVAVKRLRVDREEAAHRELRIADVLADRELDHIIPILDAGLDAASGRYFVVMARAEMSLEDRLQDGPLPEADAVLVLVDVLDGLIEAGDFIHRDLKPANVMYHDGAWKIADFGIAKFVEDATSSHTLKDFLSPPYAAPEQWRGDPCSHATDVYALGCLSYRLVSGNTPFQGTPEQLKEAHLLQQAPTPPASPRLQQVIHACLLKSPGARPGLETVRGLLRAIADAPVALPSLAAAAAVVAAQQAAQDAESERLRTEQQCRQELAADGLGMLSLLRGQLFDALEAHIGAVAQRSRDGKSISLGSGELRIDITFPLLAPGTFRHWGKDIVCGAVVIVSQASRTYPGRSANLWYADLDGSYRWWEYAYFVRTGGSLDGYLPFGVRTKERIEVADVAAAPITSQFGFAYKPEPLDGEGTESFIARWGELLAQASRSAMQMPSRLPEPER